MNRNNQNPNNQNFWNTQYSNQGYDQQYQNAQQQNFNNNPNYNVPPMYMEEPKEEKKKSILPVILTAIVTFIVLIGALYFGYNKFLKKENISIYQDTKYILLHMVWKVKENQKQT